MNGKEIFALEVITEHVRNRRLALIETIRRCLDKVYEACSRASHEEAKHLAHIVTVANRINPDLQDVKEEERERKKALEEEEERQKCQEIKRKRKDVLGS